MFSCSSQLSMKLLLINIKLLTIANYFLQNIVEHENIIANMRYDQEDFGAMYLKGNATLNRIVL